MWGQPAQPAPPAVWLGTRTIVDTSDPPATTYLQVRRGRGRGRGHGSPEVRVYTTTQHNMAHTGRGGEGRGSPKHLPAAGCCRVSGC